MLLIFSHETRAMIQYLAASGKFGYDCLVAHCGLSHLDEDFRTQRQIDVHSRTELDESHMLVDVALFVLMGIGHDAACHSSSYLAHEHFLSLRCLDDHSGTLIFGAGLGQPGLMEITVVMDYFLDETFYGKPVGMDIGDAHEDRDHQATVVEVFILLHFLYDYDASVCCSNHGLVHLSAELTDGTTEEVDSHQIERHADSQNYPEGNESDATQCIEEDEIEHHEAQ